MTLTFRPDMKAIVHEVDGRPASVVGRTIDAGGGQTLTAMVEVFDGTDLRVGAKVRCSYVEPAGVHNFDSVIISSDPLALNHRMARITIAAPTNAERVQRREHVRVAVDLPAHVRRDDGTSATCETIDLSAGGLALAWAPDTTPEVGEEIRVRFTTSRFEHDHVAMVLGVHGTPKGTVVRCQFTSLTAAERDRLVAAVFDAQRDALQRQRNATRVR